MEHRPSLEQVRAAVVAAADLLARLPDCLYEAGSPELGAVFGELDDLARRAEAGRVCVLGEAIERGVVAESPQARPAAWARAHGPSLTPGEAANLATVVQALSRPGHGSLAAAVRSGEVRVALASAVLTELGKLRPRLASQAVCDTVLESLVALAASGEVSRVRALRPALLARFGGEDEFQRDQDKLRLGVSLSQAFHDDGMSEYRLRLDPEGAAVLESALSPLAAPRPSTEDGPDLRGADRRRAEALVELLRGAVAGGRGVKTQLVLTMDFEELCRRVAAGRTLSGRPGQLLAPETVRKIACDAAVLPVVLGADSVPLDVGRSTRLFSPGQVKALWLRDGGCTFGDCRIPPQWCDAHHLVHWADGGPTSMDNAALLCARHHTYVHRHHLAGKVVTGKVSWDP